MSLHSTSPWQVQVSAVQSIAPRARRPPKTPPSRLPMVLERATGVPPTVGATVVGLMTCAVAMAGARLSIVAPGFWARAGVARRTKAVEARIIVSSFMAGLRLAAGHRRALPEP